LIRFELYFAISSKSAKGALQKVIVSKQYISIDVTLYHTIDKCMRSEVCGATVS